MTLTPRRPRVLAAALLLAAAVAAHVTIQPRPVWRVPAGHLPCGFLSDGRTLVTGQALSSFWSAPRLARGPLHLWDVGTGELLSSRSAMQADLVNPQVIPGTDTVVLREHRERGPVCLLDLRTGRRTAAGELPDDVCFSDDGRWYLSETTGADGRVAVRDVRTHRQVFEAGEGWHPFAFSRDGSRVFSSRRSAGGRGSGMRVNSLPDGKELKSSWYGIINAEPSPWLSDDGRYLVSILGLLDLEAANPRPRGLPADRDYVRFSPDGRWLVAVERHPSGWQARWYDFATVTEAVGRRLKLCDASGVVHVASRLGRFLCVNVEGASTPPFLDWLGRVSKMSVRSAAACSEHVLLDGDAGGVVAQFEGQPVLISPDTRLVVVVTPGVTDRYEVWPVPPAPRWPHALAAGLPFAALALALLIRSRPRRRPAGGPP